MYLYIIRYYLLYVKYKTKFFGTDLQKARLTERTVKVIQIYNNVKYFQIKSTAAEFLLNYS